jgi:hypothetical protein
MKQKMSIKLLGVLGAVMALGVMLVPAAQATTPAKGYEQFAGCPSPAENPAIGICLRSVVKSGHFNMGNKSVPITNPMTLSGGTDGLLTNFTSNSKGGLSPVKQQVPGGVIGLTGLDWLVNFLNIEQLKLFAVTELAGAPVFAGLGSLTLPIKVHLINPVLGNSCYVGTNASPIKLNMTTEATSPPPPNKPISGKNPELKFDEATEILHINNGTYVDNAFAAPGANGCTLTLLGLIPISLNGIVNAASGLPAAAGTNETVQAIETELVGSFKVYP